MGVRFLMRRLCTPKQQQKLHSPKHEALRSKLLTRLTPYLTSAFALSNRAMSRSVLSDPSLIGYKKTSDKKETPLKCMRLKRAPMKQETPLKDKGRKRPLMKKRHP
jgi:hypothetical protein